MRYAYKNPMIYLIDEKNEDVYSLFRENITGGPSIVFDRYHEVDKSRIKRPIYKNNQWQEGNEGKIVKNITGYDANALYLWCIGNSMPCGKLSYKTTNTSSINEIKYIIDNIFGFILVDIHTEEKDYNKFGEFPLIFKNIEYDVNKECGEYMKSIYDEDEQKDERKTRKLISSLKGERILIKSERLKWLVSKGLVVTKIYGCTEAKAGYPFKKFMEKVSDERRKGDLHSDYKIIAEMWKLVGNSAFGRTGMNKNKFNVE
jgi:hypothetical protein